MNIAIINCASQKATHGCKAIEMYKSPLFKAQSTLSNLIYDECYILSGKYGIADARKVGFGKNKTHKGWRIKKGVE